MNPKSILLIQTAFLGDLLLTIPLMKMCRKLYPEAKISLVCQRKMEHFFRHIGLIDEVYGIEKSNPESYDYALENINKSPNDLALCVHESFRTHAFLKKVNAKLKVGYKKWWNYFYFDKRVKRKMSLAEPLRALQLLRAVADERLLKKLDFLEKNYTLIKRSRESYKPSFEVPDEVDMKISTDFPNKIKEEYVALAPGSVWATKKWPRSHYAELAKGLIDKGIKVVLVGSTKENMDCSFIERQVRGITNLCGKTNLIELAGIVKHADYLISNDSAAMHMAALFETPTVSIFGPTTLDLGYRPWQNKAYVVQKNLSCRPCGKHGHDVCPLGTHACMREVSVEDVHKGLEEIKNEMA